MRKSGLLSTSAIGSAAVLSLSFGYAAPAFAQDAVTDVAAAAAAQGDAAADQSSEAAITVTGSRIRRPNLESTVPITSISGEQFFQQGDTNIGDTLNELPQLRSTYAQQNPGTGIGIAGLNLLDLRGLGTLRTLVLVNGRRHVAADILNNAVSPDINTIPNDLIERVDIVTGGNSAIYGSDAIAGVVNFVLRRDYDGIQVRGQTGLSPRGFGANQYISAMVGRNFDEGRGNVTLHAEFANQDRYFASSLPWLNRFSSFATIDQDPGGLPNGSDGFPDAVFLRDQRQTNVSYVGLIPITQPRDNPANAGERSALRDRHRPQHRRHVLRRRRSLQLHLPVRRRQQPRRADRRALQCGYYRWHPRRERHYGARGPSGLDSARRAALQRQFARAVRV